MKYPFLLILVLVMVIVAFIVGYFYRSRKRAKLPVGYVANTGYVRNLPAFASRLRKVRIGLIVMLTGAIFLAMALMSLAGKPVERKSEDQITANRDIVLCLDASGSMIPVDADIVDSFLKLVDSFHGERVSLVIWNQTSRVVFPLNDDYEMIRDQLTEARNIMSHGIVSSDPSKGVVYITHDLMDYLVGTQSLGEGEGSSFVGDGLANCALSFDEKHSDRSRSIILATDNEVAGKPAYTLPEALELTKKRGIVVNSLYSYDPKSSTGQGREELKKETEAYGGHFYDASDENAIPDIIADIESQQKHKLLDSAGVTESDRTEDYTSLLLFGTFLLLVGAAGVRL